MIVAPLLLAIVMTAPRGGGQQTLAVVLPNGFPVAQSSVSLICRDGRGQWRTVIDWQTVSGSAFNLAAPNGSRCRVLIRTAGTSAYAASAETMLTAVPQTVWPRPEWLRTVHAPAAAGEVRWVGATGDDNAECEPLPDASRCWFVPAATAGVLIASGSSPLQFAVVSRGAASVGVWGSASWGRVVRVRGTWSEIIEAGVVALRPSLKHGTGQMLEARPAPGVTIHRLAPNAFWIEGDDSPGALLELRSSGAATTRIPISSLASPSATALDLSLPAEETLTGDVRSKGAPAEGTTVMLVRVLEPSRPSPVAAKPVDPADDAQRPLERVGEAVTGANGEFAFAGLPRGRYELVALHPSRGRARANASPPAHTRLHLQPRAVIRGRVMQNGIGVPGAIVQALPSIEAVTRARNPAALGSEAVRTAVTGRFEVVAPDEGRVVLSVAGEGAAVRVDLGEAAALGEVVDIGDIKLEAPLELDIVAELPPGCVVQAAGPMGTVGLSVIRASPSGPGRWIVRPPVAGRWLVAGVCPDRELALDPSMLIVPPPTRGPILLKVRR